MATATVAELTDRVRKSTDIENADQRFSDSEIQTYLRTAHRKWQDFLWNNGAGHLVETSVTQNTSIGVDNIPLPNLYYRMLGIDADVGNNRIRTLFPLPLGERNRYTHRGTTWQRRRRLYYRVLGDKIMLYPRPDAIYELTIHYIPESDDNWFSPTTQIQGYNGWDEYLVMLASMKVLRKDNRNQSELKEELAEFEQDLISSIKGLNDGDPNVITDVDDINSYDYYYWGGYGGW